MEERWDKAVIHAREMLEFYMKAPINFFGAAAIAQCISLYEAGDRSEALLEVLEGVE